MNPKLKKSSYKTSSPTIHPKQTNCISF